MTQRTNPELWEKVKNEILLSNKAGLPNTWSARRSQLAVQEYKRRGGEYINKKDKNNPLIKWTEEKWDYINPKLKRGRYLPEKVREEVPTNIKIAEQLRKGDKKGQYVPYTQQVIDIMKKLKIY